MKEGDLIKNVKESTQNWHTTLLLTEVATGWIKTLMNKGYKGDQQGIIHCLVIVDLNVNRSSIQL